jgi:hypothetical protein
VNFYFLIYEKLLLYLRLIQVVFTLSLFLPHSVGDQLQVEVLPVSPNARHGAVSLQWPRDSPGACHVSVDLVTPSAQYTIAVTLLGVAVKNAPLSVATMSL